MNNTALNTIIDNFNHLMLEEKEFTLNILKKQIIEARRKSIKKRAKEALANYKRGKVKTGTVKELLKDLESD